jgi:hypothetical protein
MRRISVWEFMEPTTFGGREEREVPRGAGWRNRRIRMYKYKFY